MAFLLFHEILEPMSKDKSKQDHIGRGMAIMLLFTGSGHFIYPGPFDALDTSLMDKI